MIVYILYTFKKLQAHLQNLGKDVRSFPSAQCYLPKTESCSFLQIVSQYHLSKKNLNSDLVSTPSILPPLSFLNIKKGVADFQNEQAKGACFGMIALCSSLGEYILISRLFTVEGKGQPSCTCNSMDGKGNALKTPGNAEGQFGIQAQL